mmetsp:Transcript_40282/g.96567  ORF Transcript_40282/g.96567 Transcript_40282/m.96567 type:complete len:92 (-) Transcript_40282:85-360(-)
MVSYWRFCGWCMRAIERFWIQHEVSTATIPGGSSKDHKWPGACFRPSLRNFVALFGPSDHDDLGNRAMGVCSRQCEPSQRHLGAQPAILVR